ncbi:porin family protein [Bradyrhizobium diazoefficiens]|jgi:opacity protein-like surface antigen|nr:outer membrane beta-barrel protein [Bradyrhizobium diazoefficiens]MBR0968309.1 porin family protein [Bradyrhizobium diazoefficiens]MBR0977420.1 porin family protein [Bradyrhizobium diazoefficiens]MBR1007898.1 porin family protein [Bradyrhizobium diazoefficiens]MBR1013485.1 porin family protein [Bradyrhizobium diazoefficiens]MBR1050577.1 porin family protein [Bradyrhizobium diazoefficiens]
MRSVKSLLAAGAATLISSMAFAADMPIAAPPPMYAPPAPPADFGGWYLRGDVGMTNQSAKRIDSATAQTFPTTTTGLGFDSSPLFDLGVGYRFNNWFRADLIGQYRGKANLHGSDSVRLGPTDVEANNYSGSKSEWVVMANAYVDLGTWWCITPFIGAGVGGSYNKLSGFQDNGVRYTAGALSNSVTYFDTNGKWNFAWAAHAGLAYKVNPGFTVELAYSYMDLGDAAPGNYRAFDGSISGASTIKVKDITSHDVKLGVRWELNSPQPAYMPPLVTKG